MRKSKHPPVMVVIGLNSIPGSGKDFIANELVATHGWRRASIADAMRKIATADGHPMEWFVDRELKEIPRVELGGISPRQLLIDIGRKGREQGPRYWVEKLELDVEFAATDGVEGLVITDIGSQYEADWVRERGGAIVRLERPGVAPIADGRTLVEPDAAIANDSYPWMVAGRVLNFARPWGEMVTATLEGADIPIRQIEEPKINLFPTGDRRKRSERGHLKDAA